MWGGTEGRVYCVSNKCTKIMRKWYYTLKKKPRKMVSDVSICVDERKIQFCFVRWTKSNKKSLGLGFFSSPMRLIWKDSFLLFVRENHISSLAMGAIHTARRSYPPEEGAHIAISKSIIYILIMWGSLLPAMWVQFTSDFLVRHVI